MTRFFRWNVLGAVVTASILGSGFGCNGHRGGNGPEAAGSTGKAGAPRGQLERGKATPPVGSVTSKNSPTELELAKERERMVEQLAAEFNELPITDKRVLEAMRQVPRHEFVPEAIREHSYDNSPLPIGENQTISQPYIVALMTQLLELKPTNKVLEIGTGSGYQAAILGELASEVYSVEIRPALQDAAKKKLEELKARGVLHYQKLVPILGDGSKGHEAGAPFDAIMVTAAPRKVPIELLSQLKPGGRLVIPVGDFFQELQLIRKKEDGSYSSEAVVPVRFVPLMGESGEGQAR